MFIFELIGTAVGVSMDAFSVSICKGLSMKRLNYIQALIIAGIFALFQAGMPLIGFFVVTCFKDTDVFRNVISANASMIAFVLLLFLGIKMIRDAFKGKDKDDLMKSNAKESKNKLNLNFPELLALGVATSIDALMVGFAFSILEVDMILSVMVIGITTFLFSFVGVFIGHFFSSKWEKPAAIAGGIILILIGLMFLTQYLGWL